MVKLFALIATLLSISNSRQDKYDIETLREERRIMKEMKRRRNNGSNLEVGLPNSKEKE